MYTITLCCSRRFKKQARKFAKELKSLGINVYEASLDTLEETGKWEALSEIDKITLLQGLTHAHFHKIRKSDAIFVLNIDGYVGNSLNMEIGYAVALDKKIFFMEEETQEYARKILIDGYAKTPKQLVKRIRNIQTPDILD